MDELDKINAKIKMMEEVKRVRAWQEKNKEKTKEYRDKWNKENRNEYQRAYRARKK